MMRKTDPIAACAFLAALAILCLSGCMSGKDDTRVAGGDDIPNDVEPLGKQSAEARSDSAEWNGFKSMPRTSPGMYDTTTVPDSVPDTTGAGKAQPKRTALAKGSAGPLPAGDSALAAAAAQGNPQDTLPIVKLPVKPLDSLPLFKPVDTLVTRVVDTVKGTVEAVHAQVKDEVRTIDSTVFVPPDSTMPGSVGGVLQVAGRVTYADTALWKTYLFRDGDGDGFLAPRAGALNLADIELAVKGAGGLVVRTVQRVAAGADLDFNKRGDNSILSSLVTATLGADTVHTWKLLDADGDYAIIDFSKDTNLVDLVETVRFPSDPARVSLTIKVRLVVWSKDSTRNYAIGYRSLHLNRDGGTLAVTAKGPRADSTFRPGDDALLTEARTFPAGDSVESRTRIHTVRLPAAPGAFSGDLLVRTQAQARFRNRRYAAFDFSLRPEIPVADGRWPAGGAVDASLIYLDGAATSFSGQAVEAGMDGTLKAVSGETLSISFDRAGKPTRR